MRRDRPGSAYLPDQSRGSHMAQDGERRTNHSTHARPSREPLPSSPELQRFIDAVIVPALLERLLRERQPAA
jgi:hypothetical protein